MKYKLTNNSIIHNGRTLYQIEAFDKRFPEGGYIESEENLSQEDNCWIEFPAKVYCKAKIIKDAWVTFNGEIFGDYTFSQGLFTDTFQNDNYKYHTVINSHKFSNIFYDSFLYDYNELSHIDITIFINNIIKTIIKDFK